MNTPRTTRANAIINISSTAENVSSYFTNASGCATFKICVNNAFIIISLLNIILYLLLFYHFF